jgi:hypothetical protein
LGSFTSSSPNSGGVSASSLYPGEGTAFDASGNLYIGDNANNRVLIYNCTSSDGDGIPEFCNPGAGWPCIQDHAGDVNGDGYSDSDEFTPAGAPTCTGAYPATGGLGHTNVNQACPARPPGSEAATIARADVDVNGTVNTVDLAMVGKHFLQTTSGSTDPVAETDINGDGLTNTVDLAMGVSASCRVCRLADTERSEVAAGARPSDRGCRWKK